MKDTVEIYNFKILSGSFYYLRKHIINKIKENYFCLEIALLMSTPRYLVTGSFRAWSGILGRGSASVFRGIHHK